MILDRCKPIYKFLFVDHDIGFFRVAMLALIFCALSDVFCRIWMIWLCFVLILCIRARVNHWSFEEADHED